MFLGYLISLVEFKDRLALKYPYTKSQLGKSVSGLQSCVNRASMQPQYNSDMLALLLNAALKGPLSSKHTTVIHA